MLVEKFGGKPVPAVIEHVRDGSTLRAFLLPDMYHVTVMLSGVRCPTMKLGSDGERRRRRGGEGRGWVSGDEICGEGRGIDWAWASGWLTAGCVR